MARTLEQERQALEEEERRLAERREQLAKREREEAIRTIEKAGLLRLPASRLEALTKRIKALGIEGMGGSMPLMPVCPGSKKRERRFRPSLSFQNSSDMPPGTVCTTRSMSAVGSAP